MISLYKQKALEVKDEEKEFVSIFIFDYFDCDSFSAFYRFAQWYEQIMGTIFSYIMMIGFILFIFAPFRFIKDKKQI